MKYVCLVLLAIVSGIHLYHSWKDDSKNRNKTKAFILPLLIGYYCFSVDDPVTFLIVALAASWLGDVLLMPKGNKWFTFGGISFMVSHVFFMLTYMIRIDFSIINWALVIPIGLVYYSVAAVIIFKLTPTTPKPMLVPMYFYLLTNSTMNLFSLMQLISNPCADTVIAFIGAIFFFISDCTLFLVRYYRNPKIIFKKHFTVMGTYIIGEFMIAQGLIMLAL